MFKCSTSLVPTAILSSGISASYPAHDDGGYAGSPHGIYPSGIAASYPAHDAVKTPLLLPRQSTCFNVQGEPPRCRSYRGAEGARLRDGAVQPASMLVSRRWLRKRKRDAASRIRPGCALGCAKNDMAAIGDYDAHNGRRPRGALGRVKEDMTSHGVEFLGRTAPR